LGLPTQTGGPALVGGFPGPQNILPQSLELNFTSTFLQTHGSNLSRLTLLSAPDWPPVQFTPPKDLLVSCPILRDLALISQKHSGSITSISLSLDPPVKPHPLRRVSLARPNEELLSSLESALRFNVTSSSVTPLGRSPIANTRQTSLLPSLSLVKFTSVRWLKLNSDVALRAGTSGGMRQWRTVLRRYGVLVLDMDNSEV